MSQVGTCINVMGHIAFNEKNELCSSVFIHSNLEIVLQGNISVAVSSIPVMETSPKCPEFELNTSRSEESQTDDCKNVKGYGDIVTCASYYDDNECRIDFWMECGTILGPFEVVYQCNDGSGTHRVMVIYSLQIMSLDLSRNNLIEI